MRGDTKKARGKGKNSCQKITLTFFDQEPWREMAGAINYHGACTLTGTDDSFGKEIETGPIISTMIYCVGTS